MPKNSSYINASPITMITPTYYSHIAAQAPLKSTLHSFFQMIRQFNIHTIITACNDFENGMEKCCRYWPNFPTEVTFSPINQYTVSLVGDQIDRGGYVVNIFWRKKEAIFGLTIGMFGCLIKRSNFSKRWFDKSVFFVY